jgi:hypothetical protein
MNPSVCLPLKKNEEEEGDPDLYSGRHGNLSCHS